MTAFRKRSTYRPDSVDVRPWLYGIAANLLRRHQREEATRYRALARCYSADDVGDEWDAAHDRMDAARLRRGDVGVAQVTPGKQQQRLPVAVIERCQG